MHVYDYAHNSRLKIIISLFQLKFRNLVLCSNKHAVLME